jgi:hypothetical protein
MLAGQSIDYVWVVMEQRPVTDFPGGNGWSSERRSLAWDIVDSPTFDRGVVGYELGHLCRMDTSILERVG